MTTSFYTKKGLRNIGLAKVGDNVKISKKAVIYTPENVTIGSNVRIDDFALVSGSVSIGSYVHIAAYCALYAQEKQIIIEDFCGLAARISIYTFSEDYIFGQSLTNPTIPEQFIVKMDIGSVILKKHVVVGVGSVILPNTVIGSGAAIGALSLVRGELEPWGIYTGNPARRKGTRRSKKILELAEKLSKTK